MSGGQDTAEPLVSVQVAGARDAIEGHVAWGRLIHADCVIVHGPPWWLRRRANLEVLLAFEGPEDALQVERIRVSSMRICGINNRPELQFTCVNLMHASSAVADSVFLDKIFDGPGNNQEHLRAVLDVLMSGPVLDWTKGVEDLLEPVVHKEEQACRPIIEDDTVSDQWVSDWPPKSLFRRILGI